MLENIPTTYLLIGATVLVLFIVYKIVASQIRASRQRMENYKYLMKSEQFVNGGNKMWNEYSYDDEPEKGTFMQEVKQNYGKIGGAGVLGFLLGQKKSKQRISRLIGKVKGFVDDLDEDEDTDGDVPQKRRKSK